MIHPVTVVIAVTGDYEHFLERALESVNQQTQRATHIALAGYGLRKRWVDDQIDAPRETFELPRALNLLIAKTTTPYVLWLGADDTLDPTYLERCMPHITPFRVVTPGFRDLDDATQFALTPERDFPLRSFADRNLAVYSAIFPRCAWEYVGGFRPVPYLDWDFWVRVRASGFDFYGVQAPLLRYRGHTDSLFLSPTAHTAYQEQLRHAYEHLF